MCIGKSLTGVIALSTIKKSSIILCINNASVLQWKEQLLLWTTVQESCIKMFTKDYKQSLPSTPCIVITTYHMICHSGKRSEEGEAIIRDISNRYGMQDSGCNWGIVFSCMCVCK